VNINQSVQLLVEKIQMLEVELRKRPIMRQGVVTIKTPGTPFKLTVTLDEGDYDDVICTDSTVVVGDTVWLLVMPNGTRVSFGDAKSS
jgi:hypothetical protein